MNYSFLKRFRNLIPIVCLALILSGCCTKNSDGTETCSVTLSALSCNNTVTGYLLFTNGVTPTSGADLVVQWSTDSFVTVTNPGVIINNSQGFVVIPFSFSASYTCGTVPNIQIRTFQSPSSSDVWVTGSPVGRYDGTSNGHAAYTTILASSASNLFIYVDGTGAQ